MRDRNKFLTEAMGKCWHECVDFSNWTDETKPPYCVKCRMDIFTFEKLNPDYSTWQGFGELWSWAIKQEWWGQSNIFENNCWDCGSVQEQYINPDKFAQSLYNFLKERDNKENFGICGSCGGKMKVEEPPPGAHGIKCPHCGYYGRFNDIIKK